MLNNLYVFHSTGKLLFSKNWKAEGIQEDPVLISGFLSAIWMFAQKIGSKGVRAIHTEKDLLIGISSPTYDLLFVLVANPKADVAEVKRLLGRIRQSFIQKHRTLLKQDTDFSTDAFDEWSANLESIMDEVDVAPVETRMKELVKGLSFTDDESTNEEQK